MNCPKCEAGTKVIDSRDVEGGTRRRHCCRVCSHRFTTIERQEDEHAKPDPELVKRVRNMNLRFLQLKAEFDEVAKLLIKDGE
jgi:transcriptional regulator NrdR family protein